MPFVIQLFFDQPAEEAIRAVARALFESNLTCNDPSKDRPHISIASCIELQVDAVCKAVEILAGKHVPFRVTLHSVGSFLSPEGVVFIAPIALPQLLEIQEAAMEIVRTCGIGINHYYMPGRWCAHCTLASQLKADAIGKAIQHCVTDLSSFEAAVESLALVEYGDGLSVTHACYPLYELSGGI